MIPYDHGRGRKHFWFLGYSWILEWDVSRHRVGDGWSEWYGEVIFETLTDSARGGSYWVMHDEETGEFDLYEVGGSGPNVWDNFLSHHGSPVAAMRAARRDYFEYQEVIRQEEEAYERMIGARP